MNNKRTYNKTIVVVNNKDYKVEFDQKNEILKCYYYNKVNGSLIYQGFNYHELDGNLMTFGQYNKDQFSDDDVYTWERVYEEDFEYFKWLVSVKKKLYQTYHEIRSGDKKVCLSCNLTETELFMDTNYCLRCFFEKIKSKNKNDF